MMNHKEVLVSVVMPTFRREKTLKRALDSLLKQKHKNVEIIVVDDNGDLEWNNKVKRIINEKNIGDNIKLVCNLQNIGSAESRNKGIEVSKGEYITFLDDDDIYMENKISHQVEVMIKERSDYSVTNLSIHGENGKLIEIRNRDYIEKKDRESLIKYHIMYNITGTNTFMFKREYLLKIDMFSPIDIGDDFYLMMKAIENNGKFSYVKSLQIKAFVHTNTSGLSSGKGKIQGENRLFLFKKQYWHILNKRERRYVRMRHNLVKSYAYYRMKNIIKTMYYFTKSFIASPFNLFKIIFRRKKI